MNPIKRRIQQFGAELIGNDVAADQAQRSDEQNVVARDVRFRIDEAEKSPWKSPVAPHPIQQPRAR